MVSNSVTRRSWGTSGTDIASRGGVRGAPALPGNLRCDDVPLVLLVPQVPPTIRNSRTAETSYPHFTFL